MKKEINNPRVEHTRYFVGLKSFNMASLEALNLAVPVIIILSLIFVTRLNGQNINISDNLTLVKLTNHTYIHTSHNNNGIVYFNNGEAIIVSTPDSDIETQNLINWVRDKQQAKIVAYVIDRWHPDAMEGLDVVIANQIASYAHKHTRVIARKKELPITSSGFKTKKKINVGRSHVLCHFLGETHTSDGIVVWVPDEQIPFGGNGVRNFNGWIGNIADTNLNDWSETITKVKEAYGTARFVVPGHGSHSGVELLDYTIDLYEFPKEQHSRYHFNTDSLVITDTLNNMTFSTFKKNNGETLEYIKGIMHFKGKQYKAEIQADLFQYDRNTRNLFVPKGYLKIMKEDEVIGFHFNQLYFQGRDDYLESTLVIKEVNSNY